MPKRTILSLAVAALFAITAQGAVAAMPSDPTQQEMDHGVQPTVESGYGDYGDEPAVPESGEPEATESIPTPAEPGISTSAGAVQPVVGSGALAPPEVPEAQQAEADEGDAEPPASCSQLAAELDRAEAMSGIGLVFGNAIGGPIGSILRDEGVDWQFEVERIDDQAREQGCYAGEGSAA